MAWPTPTRPHNELIQIAASLGFPALGLYLVGLFQWAKLFVQKWKQLGLFDLGGGAGGRMLPGQLGFQQFHVLHHTVFLYVFGVCVLQGEQ